jgi:hypothetical protein
MDAFKRYDVEFRYPRYKDVNYRLRGPLFGNDKRFGKIEADRFEKAAIKQEAEIAKALGKFKTQIH